MQDRRKLLFYYGGNGRLTSRSTSDYNASDPFPDPLESSIFPESFFRLQSDLNGIQGIKDEICGGACNQRSL